MTGKRKRKPTWQEELKNFPIDEEKLAEAVKALCREEVRNEVDKMPKRYLKPFEKENYVAGKNKKRSTRQKWEIPDELAAALAFRWIHKLCGGYQNLDEGKTATRVFARKQRIVRSKCPKYEDVPKLKPRTCKSLGERLAKKREAYDAFFDDPENRTVVQLIDKAIDKHLIEEEKQVFTSSELHRSFLVCLFLAQFGGTSGRPRLSGRPDPPLSGC